MTSPIHIPQLKSNINNQNYFENPLQVYLVRAYISCAGEESRREKEKGASLMKSKVSRQFSEFKATYHHSTEAVRGRAITFPGLGIDDLAFFLYRNPISNFWNICEVSSGWKVSGGSTITEAVDQFASHLERHGGVETLRKLVLEVEKVF